MSLTIRAMTNEEFDSFFRWSVENHTKELMMQSDKTQDEAISEANAEVKEMLPEGLSTAQNHLMTFVETGSNENLGFIWTLYEVTAGRKQSFICDFAIWEPYRRKGYGAAALFLAEAKAMQDQCVESVLFVRDDNGAARALYQKCGYQVLRQAGCGKYMIKQLYPFHTKKCESN